MSIHESNSVNGLFTLKCVKNINNIYSQNLVARRQKVDSRAHDPGVPPPPKLRHNSVSAMSIPSRLVQAVRILHCIQLVPGSILGIVFFMVFLRPFRRIPGYHPEIGHYFDAT
jgi:hypothetical protein